MADSEKKQKNLLMRVKEESQKAGLKFYIQKTKTMASGPITSWKIDGGKNGSSDRFSFLGLQNHCGQWLQPWNKKMLALWKESSDKPSCCSVAKSCLTLWPHGLQHAKHPCPTPSSRVCPSSGPLHWWCHPAISFSVALCHLLTILDCILKSRDIALPTENHVVKVMVLPVSCMDVRVGP